MAVRTLGGGLRETGGGIDDAGGADAEKKINVFQRGEDRVHLEGKLAKPHDVRAQAADLAAGAAARGGGEILAPRKHSTAAFAAGFT